MHNRVVAGRTNLIQPRRRAILIWGLIALLIAALAVRGLTRHRVHAAGHRAAAAMITAFYAAHDGPAAVFALDRAIRSDPSNGELFNLRGATLQDLGRFDEAERDFVKATKLDPGNASAWHNLIALQDWRGSADGATRARAYEERVVGADRSSALYHRNLARLLDGAHDRRGAEREFRTAIALAPTEGSYYLELSDYLQQGGPEERAQAIALLEDGLARHASDGGTLTAALAQLAFTLQDYGLAANTYGEASKLSPHNPEYRAMALEAQRRAARR